MDFTGTFGIEDDLHQATDISKIDEYQPAVIAPAMDPAAQRYVTVEIVLF